MNDGKTEREALPPDVAAAFCAQSRDGLCVTDRQGGILCVNDAFCRMSGYTEAELLGRHSRLLKSGKHDAAFYAAIWAGLADAGQWQGEITNRRKDGELYNGLLNIAALRDGNGEIRYYVAVISELSQRSKHLQRLIHYDALTDLPNQALFYDRLEQALSLAARNHQQLALILLDLDRFRTLNDAFGRVAGDSILLEVAQRLRRQLRCGDSLARLSGNEFCFILTGLHDEQHCFHLARRILENIALPIELAGQSVVVTASMGIGIYPKDGANADALLRAANTALVRAKDAGRNAFRFFAPDMESQAMRRLQIENHLRTALERREFSLVYQPQVSLESGTINGMEALLRWNSPQLGAVGPAEFIPVAEDNGLVVPIGAWVLREACRQVKTWRDLGLPPLRVAVNLSARQFREENLCEMVGAVLADSQLPANALELEVTESALIHDLDQAVAICRDLHQTGIKISLDDFGTGYSSFAYVSRFPFDKLKIDQSFVSDITSNPANAAIASAAIAMARNLNLAVLAEGVETEAQALFLRRRHCDSMQGYLFSPPLSADEFALALRDGMRLDIGEASVIGDQALLILDDEQSILNSLARLFRHERFHVLTANDPETAFRLLASNRVQVVVSDQRMPAMSGTEFLSRVRQLYPETLRIVLSGFIDLQAVTDAINRGAVYKFLTKPWDDDQLREQIREAFRLARQQQESP